MRRLQHPEAVALVALVFFVWGLYLCAGRTVAGVVMTVVGAGMWYVVATNVEAS